MQSLRSLHTFGLDAYCNNIIALNSDTDIANYFATDRESWLLLGQGSNCVFVEDFAGDILLISLSGKRLQQDVHYYKLSVGAGENWHQLVQWCLTQGIYGLENLALIPGLVGAAPIQNIGAYGVEVANFIHAVDYLDLEKCEFKRLTADECQFGYRDSIFKRQLVGRALITQVHFRLPKKWKPVTDYAELKALSSPTALDIFKKVVAVRQAKLPDPRILGNAGSFFKNPVISRTHYQSLASSFVDIPHYVVDAEKVKVPAAWLIDRLGFKGQVHKGVACHAKQPLVLVNQGDATGEALLEFARRIRSAVCAEFEIKLENEVNLVGSKGLITL